MYRNGAGSSYQTFVWEAESNSSATTLAATGVYHETHDMIWGAANVFHIKLYNSYVSGCPAVQATIDARCSGNPRDFNPAVDFLEHFADTSAAISKLDVQSITLIRVLEQNDGDLRTTDAQMSPVFRFYPSNGTISPLMGVG